MISTSWRWAEESWSPMRLRAGPSNPYSARLRCTCSLSARRSRRAAAGQLADPDVFGDVDAGDDLRLLVDDADAGGVGLARVGEAQRLAVDRQRAGIRLVVAVDDLEQRGLAGPVLAHKGENLAGPDVERDVGEGLDVGERLADVANLEGAGAARRRLLRRRREARSWSCVQILRCMVAGQVRAGPGLTARTPRADRLGDYFEQLASEIWSMTSL